jgi:hypothetical protein
VETSLRQSRENWRAVGEYERKEAEANQRGDKEVAAEWHKRGQEAKERAEQHDHEEHDHVQRVRPDRVPDLDDTHRHIRAANEHLDAATAHLTPEQARAVKANAKAAYLGDANAQVELEQKAGKLPPTSRRYMKEAAKEQEKITIARDANLHQRDEKKANTAQTNQRSDAKLTLANAGLDALNDDERKPEPKKAAVTPVSPSRPVQSAQNAKTISNQPTV